MGGKRIAEQVRRALIAAAKTAAVAGAIDAAGCRAHSCIGTYCGTEETRPCPSGAGGWFYGTGGYGAYPGTGGRAFTGSGGNGVLDGSSDAHDDRSDGPKSDASTGAAKDGG